MGASKGGMNALHAVLGPLPGDFPVPIAVVLHRGKDSDEIVIEMLQRQIGIRIVEPTDKQPLLAGCIYLAPADYHLLIDNRRLALSTEGPVCRARPSIDVLFESAVDEYGEHVIGVVLSGASPDGAQGMKAIKSAGGLTVVQDPASAESKIMPEASIERAAVDHIVPPEAIASLLVKLCL